MFNDTSLTGFCAEAYTVVNQQNIFSQNLITTKSRLARKNLSIPRLELVAAHMSANLAENIKICLSKLNIREIYPWSDSTTVLHWLKDNGEHKIFVSKRGSKIKGRSFIEWKSVPTKENPADLGSRGCEICKLDNKWWEGPKWFQDQTQWAEELKNMFHKLLSKFSLLKTLRVLSWKSRFLSNSSKHRLKGPLTTN